MISVRIRTGNGDREAPAVSDALIITEPMAITRGRQELTGYANIVKARRIRVPHDPDATVDEKKDMVVHSLGISGEHMVSGLSIEITPKGIYDALDIEQCGEMPR